MSANAPAGQPAAARLLRLAAGLAIAFSGQLAVAQSAPEAAAAKPKLRSPFMPRGTGGDAGRVVNAPTNTPLDQIEFRGITFIGSEKLYSIFDPTSSRGYWLREGDSQAGYTLVAYKSEMKAVTVRSSAGDRQVALKTVTTDVPAGQQAGMQARPGNITPLSAPPGQPPGPGGNAGLPPGSFPLNANTPAPPGYILVRQAGAPNGTTYALPPGSAVPAGFSAVTATSTGTDATAQPTRRRIVVDPRQRTNNSTQR